MKIAVLDTHGVQNTKQGKLQYYYDVVDNYDFSGNSATNVTDIPNLRLLSDNLRLNYCDYRDSLISYATGVTFSSLTITDKRILVKNLAVNKVNRDSVYSSEEQIDFSSDIQRKIYLANEGIIFDTNTTEIVSNSDIPTFVENSTPTEYKLYELVNLQVKRKNVKDINYITELKSGIKLHPVQSLTNSGLLEKTEFYYGFTDLTNKGELILTVEETYTTQEADSGLTPTARTVVSRDKTRKWVKMDGTIDEDNVKITTKKYDTSRKSNAEGSRRRTNIIDVLSSHTGLGGVLSGIFIDENDANDKLTLIMEDFSTAISTYIKTGRGSLFELMENDVTHTWLDSVVIDTPYTQAMVPYMIGMDLRTYIIAKLKGIIS